MPTYEYNVVIKTQYDSTGVASGTKAQNNALFKMRAKLQTDLEREEKKHQNKLAQIHAQGVLDRQKSDSKLEQINKQSSAKMFQGEQQHLNKILEINRKASLEKQKLFIRETQAFDAHKRKLELLETKSNARLNEIQKRGETKYKSSGGLSGMLGGGLLAGGTLFALNQLSGVFDSLTQSMTEVGKQAITLSANLQQTVANISSIKPEIDNSQVFKALNELQTRVPQTADQLGKSLYDVFSSINVTQEEGLRLVELFSKGALGAATDAQTFGTAVIGVMNAYHLEVSEATRVSDLFFNTVKSGVVTGEQLAGGLGAVTASAKSAGQSIEVLFAAITASTKAGGDAAQNINNVNNLFAKLSNSETASKFLDNINIRLDDGKGSFKQLNVLIEEFNKKTKDLDAVAKANLISKIFPDAQARQAFTTLLSQFDAFNAALKENETQIGATDAAYNKMSGTFNVQYQLLKNTVFASLTELGVEILPTITEEVKALSETLRENKESFSSFGRNIRDIYEQAKQAVDILSRAIDGVNIVLLAYDTAARLMSVGLALVFNQPIESAFRYYAILRTILSTMRSIATGGVSSPIPDFSPIRPDLLTGGRSGINPVADTRGVGLAGLKLFNKPPGGGGGYDGGTGGGRKQTKSAAQKDAIENYIIKSAADNGIDPDLVRAVMAQESGGRLKAVSNKGAGGLMQLMPGTFDRMDVGNKRFDAGQNIAAGAKYLGILLRMFNGDVRLALAAYNAGEGAVIKYGGKIPPYAETQKYVPEVLSRYAELKGKGKEGTILSIGGQQVAVSSNAIAEAIQRLKGLGAGQPLTTPGQGVSGAFARQETTTEEFRRLRSEGTANAQAALDLRAANIEQEKFLDGIQQKINLEGEYYDLEVRLSSLLKEQGDVYLENIRRSNLVTGERIDLETRLMRIGDEMATGGINLALRQQVAIQEEILNLRREEFNAIENIGRLQVQLASKGVYSPAQDAEKVLEFLNQTRSVTEVIADAKINVIQSTYDLIDRGLDKVTSKLGTVGSILKDLISGFARLALSKFFQMIFGGGGATSGGQSQGGGGGFLQNIFGGLLGGNRGGTTVGGFGGGTFNVGGNFTGGLPINNAPLFPFLTPSPRNPNPTAYNAATGAAGGIKGLLGSLAPLLGLSLGAQLGAGSVGGSILGGAGGLLAGGTLAALLAPTALTGLGLSSGLVGGIAAAAPFLLPIAGAALIGSYFISRSKKRREQETQRNQAMLDAFSQVDQLIKDVKADKIDGSSALASFQNIRSEYLKFASSLTDKKTRRHALADVHRIDAKLPALQAEIDSQKARQARVANIVPTFASGGYVGAFNGRMPGVFDRKDDRLIRVSGNEVVLNPKQYAPIQPYLKAIRVPGFASGGMTNNAPSTGAAMAATLAGKIHVENHFYNDHSETAISYVDENGMKHLVEKVTNAMAKDIQQKRDSHQVVRAVEVATGRRLS